MSLLEIVIFTVGLLFSVIAHCIAWAIYCTVAKILDRLKFCDDNMKSASKLLEYSSITGSVLQLGADQLHFDPDVNEFERDVAVLMLKDPQLSYTGETMNRPKQASKPTTTERSEVKAPPKPTGKAGGGGTSQKQAKEAAKQKQSETKAQAHPQEPPSSDNPDENPAKKKFKPPPNITKADAKDPQYETLRGIGNELFAGNKKEDEKEEKQKEEKPAAKTPAEKKAFKEPPKVQKADAKDPQYETLAEVKDDIFKG